VIFDKINLFMNHKHYNYDHHFYLEPHLGFAFSYFV